MMSPSESVEATNGLGHIFLLSSKVTLSGAETLNLC